MYAVVLKKFFTEIQASAHWLLAKNHHPMGDLEIENDANKINIFKNLDSKLLGSFVWQVDVLPHSNASDFFFFSA